MEIIGRIIAYFIIGGMFFLLLGVFAFLLAVLKNSRDISKNEKKGIYYIHDGWKDGTWYGGCGGS